MKKKEKTIFTVKEFGSGGAHLIVPKAWLGLKIEIIITEPRTKKQIAKK